MSCKQIQDLEHGCAYNAGGVRDIFLLDVDDFIAYQFEDDGLYDSCFITRIVKADNPYIYISCVGESAFQETNEDGLYKQQLTTFVRTLAAGKLSSLLRGRLRRYVVVFRTYAGTMFSFGSDGGATVSFTQASGQMGQASGYQLTISKDSVYPLLEMDARLFNVIEVLGTEGLQVVSTDDDKNALLIYNVVSGSGGGEPVPEEPVPDAYESLYNPKGSIFHVFDNVSHGDSLGFANWDWDKNVSTYNTQTGQKGACQRTYNTISVDEYEWMTENLSAPVSTDHQAKGWWGTQYNWMDYTQAEIDRALGYTGVGFFDFSRHFGTLFSQYDGVKGYRMPGGYKVYDRRTDEGGTPVGGWELPDRAALLQLIGECPRRTGDFWTDVKEFLFCRPDQNVFNLSSGFYRHKNISGLSLVPLGGRGNQQYVGKVYDLGGICQLMTKDSFYTRFVEHSSEDTSLKGFYLQVWFWHLAAVRYCRAKSDDELGYRLYVDVPNDRVLMLGTSEDTSLPELQKGLERGVALRWASRKHRLVCKPWSEIQNESNELRRYFTDLVE